MADLRGILEAAIAPDLRDLRPGIVTTRPDLTVTVIEPARQAGQLSLTTACPELSLRIATFDQGNLITLGVVADFVHEGANEQHASTADILQIGRVGGIGEVVE